MTDVAVPQPPSSSLEGARRAAEKLGSDGSPERRRRETLDPRLNPDLAVQPLNVGVLPLNTGTGRASLGGASAPRSLPGGVSRSRRSARAFASGAHAPGSIADWVERELDFGDVSRVSSQGGSAWASFSTLETTSGKRLFVKTSRSGPEMFAGEGAGLRAMHAACVVEDEDSSSSDSSSRYSDGVGGFSWTRSSVEPTSSPLSSCSRRLPPT